MSISTINIRDYHFKEMKVGSHSVGSLAGLDNGGLDQDTLKAFIDLHYNEFDSVVKKMNKAGMTEYSSFGDILSDMADLKGPQLTQKFKEMNFGTAQMNTMFSNAVEEITGAQISGVESLVKRTVENCVVNSIRDNIVKASESLNKDPELKEAFDKYKKLMQSQQSDVWDSFDGSSRIHSDGTGMSTQEKFSQAMKDVSPETMDKLKETVFKIGQAYTTLEEFSHGKSQASAVIGRWMEGSSSIHQTAKLCAEIANGEDNHLLLNNNVGVRASRRVEM